jgi:2-phosphosulfolactate phosphatase
VEAAPTVVVVDVLSFTTCVDVALSRGVAVFPYPWNDDSAVAFAAERGAVLASRRAAGGYSLSPSSLLEAPRGMRLVLPSPNGAALAQAAGVGSRSRHVLAAALRNARAVAAAARGLGGPVTIVMAGERWPNGSLRPALEDLLGAGAVVSHLDGTRSPEAAIAAAAFEAIADRLGEVIAACASGRELIELGFAHDVELASALNVSRSTPFLDGGAFVDRC